MIQTSRQLAGELAVKHNQMIIAPLLCAAVAAVVFLSLLAQPVQI